MKAFIHIHVGKHTHTYTLIIHFKSWTHFQALKTLKSFQGGWTFFSFSISHTDSRRCARSQAGSWRPTVNCTDIFPSTHQCRPYLFQHSIAILPIKLFSSTFLFTRFFVGEGIARLCFRGQIICWHLAASVSYIFLLFLHLPVSLLNEEVNESVINV